MNLEAFLAFGEKHRNTEEVFIETSAFYQVVIFNTLVFSISGYKIETIYF